MSGNPFRRQGQQEDDSHPAVEATSIPNTGSTRKTTKGKRVRIATPPPLSPESFKSPDSSYDEYPPYQPLDESGALSPANDVPQAQSLSNIGAVWRDAYATDSEGSSYQGRELDTNTGGNRGSNLPPSETNRALVNPFERTLATMENTNTLDTTRYPGLQSSQPTAGGAKPTMDVDSFKRLLLTGTAAPSLNTLSPSTPTSSLDSAIGSSASDPSSVSYQSMNETNAVALEDLRTSQHGLRPGDEDVIPTSESTKKTKPPPPKPRHGKPLAQQRTPQIVSFSDFAPSGVPNIPPRTTPKMAPPPPSIGRASSVDESASDAPPSQSSLPVPDPPPPRGSNAIRSLGPPRPRADSNLSISSQQSASGRRPSDDTNPSKARPPPPPPTRRAGKPISDHQAPTSTTSFPAIHIEPHAMNRSPDPISSRRGSIVPADPSSRSSSISTVGRAGLPPPPPPPRRRASSNLSIDLGRPPSPTQAFTDSRRPSGERRRPSHVELAGVSEGEDEVVVPVTATRSNDMLAELDSLRAEVEALRQNSRRPS